MTHKVILCVYEMSDNQILSSSKSKLVNNAKYRACEVSKPNCKQFHLEMLIRAECQA